MHDAKPGPNALSAQVNRVRTDAPRADVRCGEGEVICALGGAGVKTETPVVQRGAASSRWG